MKLLVPIKRVPSADEPVRVRPDGTGIEDDGRAFMINPFDAIALEEALRIRDSHPDGGEVLAVCIGDSEVEAELRTALAMGADRGLRVACEASLDSLSVAKILAGVVRREGPAMVLAGKQAVDSDAGQAGPMLAGLLDWPQATFASVITFLEDGRVQVVRETDHGLETLRLCLPAVITADLRLNEPRYASLPAIMRARRKPIETLPVADLGMQPQSRVVQLRMEQSTMARECVRVADTDELLHRLRSEAKVI